MPFLCRAIACVLVVAWIFAGCAGPSQQRQPGRDVSSALRHETNRPSPPVGYWVVDARTTAHAAAARYGFQTNMRVEGTRTNYSYTYYGPARNTYDRVLKSASDRSKQRRLVLGAGGAGEDWLITSTGSATAPVPFQWAGQEPILEFEYQHVTVKAAFNGKEIQYPTPEGVLIFVRFSTNAVSKQLLGSTH